jgi:hypothetical protein
MKAFSKISSKLLAIKSTPEKVSRGYALGVFLGTTPFIGTKVIIALSLTSFLRWSRLASVIGVYHINIITAPLFYSCAYGIGKWLIGSETNLIISYRLSFECVINTFFSSWEIILALSVGGLLLGIPLSAIAYYLSYVFLSKRMKTSDALC